MTDKKPERVCPPRAQLEAWVEGVNKGDEQALQEHLNACRACCEAVNALRTEKQKLRHILQSISAPKTPHIEYEELGMYLDGSGSTAEREACEAHLAACASCRRGLIELLHERRTSASPEGMPETVAARPAGEVLKYEEAPGVEQRDKVAEDTVPESEESRKERFLNGER